MSAESYSPGSDRSRWRGVVLALAIEGLILLLLLQLGTGIFIRTDKQPKLTTFDVRPVGPPVSKQAQRTAVANKRKKVRVAPSDAPPAPAAPLPVKAPPSKLIQLSPEDYASSDIGKIKSARDDGDDAGSGKNSVAAYGPGEGPGGGAIYDVEEWYRKPPRNALASYLPKNAESGWAAIACKTVPDYRVENCRSLGESPVGSGLARAMREAAWQFRVRPPRVNGKPLVGVWVRIKWDVTIGYSGDR